ncbi:MAG TPA: YciI family protein [Caulobacteraceae bacterium]|jgi:hypothetical protein|nr:YciI family protein [Caulobacteraceae bacterium]
MPLFVLSCIDKPGSLDVRLGAREAHLAHMAAHAAMVKAAGPYLDEAGQPAGSMILLDAPDRAAVEAFAAADPYRLAGLFERVDIHAWRVSVGSLS